MSPNSRPSWVDFHVHLDLPAFDADRDAVLARARAAGVCDVVVPGVSRATWPRLDALGGRAGWHVAYGLHPCFDHAPGDAAALDAWLDAHPETVAVGEIGLDGTRPDRDAQREVFRAQLSIARAHGRPVIVHAHRALEDVLLDLRAHVGAGHGVPTGVVGVVHAFSGSDVQLDRLLDLGLAVGIGGPVTYPRAARLRRQVARLPADRLWLETDAPDQPLRGRQGQRNEPAQVVDVAAVVAELREVPPARLATEQRENLARLLAAKRATGASWSGHTAPDADPETAKPRSAGGEGGSTEPGLGNLKRAARSR